MAKFVTSHNFGGLATTTTPGVISIATQAEVDAGIICDKAVVPCTLDGYITTSASQATETSNGTAEIATQLETNAGLDDTRFITPLKLVTYVSGAAVVVATQPETDAGVIDNKYVSPLKLHNRNATETLTGIAEIATQAETNAGVDDMRFVTPLKLVSRGVNNFASTSVAGPILNGSADPLFATAATLITAVLPAGTYAYFVSFQMRHTSAGRNVTARLRETLAGVIESLDEESEFAGALVAQPCTWCGTIVLAAGATTFTLEFARSSFNQPGGPGSSAEIKGIRMSTFRVA